MKKINFEYLFMWEVDGMFKVYPGDDFQTGGRGQGTPVCEVPLCVEGQQNVQAQSQVQMCIWVRKLDLRKLADDLWVNHVVIVGIIQLNRFYLIVIELVTCFGTVST